jgi:AcrR family transcriptional regulator
MESEKQTDPEKPEKPENLEPDTEKKILEAAGKVFMLKGRLGTSMQDIADEAGINRTLLHYYFRNKEKLFDTIFEKVLASSFPSLMVAFTSERPFMEKIHLFVNTWTDLLKENPYLPVFVIQEITLNPERLAGFIRRVGLDPDVAMQSIQKNLESYGLGDMDPRHLVANLLGTVLFPYIGRPLFQLFAFKGDRQAYERFLDDRREQIPRFFKRALGSGTGSSEMPLHE